MTFGLGLERMARAFSRLEALDGGARVTGAMRARPELVRGDGAPDTELMRLGDGWTAKGGAEGLLCVGYRDGVGFALKAEDGATRAVGPAAGFLFGVSTLAVIPTENSRGDVVGRVVAQA